MRARRLIAAAIVGTVLAIGAGGYAIGLYGYERHRGFFAPAWDETGDAVLVLRRSTSGFVWGLGWEFFSPPAYSYVTGDRFELLRVSRARGEPEVLARWSGSPLVGRVTRHYRGRIFNYVTARLDPSADGMRIRVRMSIPRVPSSESWGVDAVWHPRRAFRARWVEGVPGGLGRAESTLTAGREVFTVPGREGFDAAVLVVEADGSHSVLVRNGDFDTLFPDGVPARLVAERSQRKQIDKARNFRRVQAELVARFRAEGLKEGDAILRAYDEMERMGYLPRKPRITATPLEKPPENLPAFEIPARYLDAGLFQDIAKAVGSPGSAVRTGLGTYLAYGNDDLGPRLKAFREGGGNRFAVRIDGRLFLIEQDQP